MLSMQTSAELTTDEAADFLGVSVRTVERRCVSGELQARKVNGNGGPQYRISLSSLPMEAQNRYYKQKMMRYPAELRRELLLQMNLDELRTRRLARECGVAYKAKKLEQLPWTQEELAAREREFMRMDGKHQRIGNERADLMRELDKRLRMTPEGERTACMRQLAQEMDMAMSTLYDFKKRIANLEPNCWRIALAPAHDRKGRKPLPIDERILKYILGEWGCTSKPPLKPIVQRARKIAQEMGVSLPSYDAIKKRINDIPKPQRILMREGPKALDAAIPPMRRDYSQLGLHDVWCADGRVADVHCRWPDGYVGRPVVVAFMDLRSRMVVGWALGRTESAHLVRQALSDALHRTRAVPRKLYLDNGRGFAAKEITGQQATRNRFKNGADDVMGLSTLLGISVIWAQPYNGKAKPIESFWNTVANGVDKRRAFSGAYCGNKPGNRPEEHSMAKAVPIEEYERVLREEMQAYAERPHRGDAMNGESPRQVYERLAPDCQAVQPTQEQLKCCLLAAVKVRLTREGEIIVLGNRYGCDELTALQGTGPYTARYDPEDSAKPVQLFDGQRFVMAVPLIARTGFADREAVQRHRRAKNNFKRAVKEQVRSLQEMDKARSWERATDTPDDAANALPRVGVPSLLHPAADWRAKSKGDGQAAGADAISVEEFRAMRDRGQEISQGLQEHEPRRVAGGM